MLLVSQALLWALVIVLALAVAALARQVGVLHERIAPVGALVIDQGPKPGEPAPRGRGRTLEGAVAEVGLPRGKAPYQLMLFVAPDCPICKVVVPTAQLVAQAEGLDLLLVGDGDLKDHQAMAAGMGIAPEDMILSEEIGRLYQVGKLPHAVLLDAGGVVAGQGLVNNREHLESLLTARETGFASLQDYLKARHAGAAEIAHHE